MHLVTVDRPGVGGSDLQPGRRLAGWPLDVVDLADALDFDRFAVVGYSAGGPYALACAALIGEQVTRAGLVSTSPFPLPGERPGAMAALDEDDQHDFELLGRIGRQTAAQTFAIRMDEWAQQVADDPRLFLDPTSITDQNRCDRRTDRSRHGPRSGPDFDRQWSVPGSNR